jgi:hypothetical protein
MQVQLDIEFDQLVKLAKRLPVNQWTKLKQQVDKKVKTSRTVSGLEAFLMAAPTYTKKQLNEIDKTRKAINQWRTK